MKIDKIRQCFASNSSSTHSIIIAGTHAKDGGMEETEFGWSNFIQDTKYSKSLYLAQTFYTAAKKHLDDWTLRSLINTLFAIEYEEGYVDHQSALCIPLLTSGKLAIEFFRDMSNALIADDNAVIEGGNDNSDEDRGERNPDWDLILLLQDRRNPDFLCRKDGTVWTVFNKLDGTKFKIDFTAPHNAPSIDQKGLKIPELVDIKITDYCDKGCDFCYQDSNKDGKHANVSELISDLEWFKWLDETRPFEIAFGGGEPTTHPEFSTLLKTCKELNIIPNFTTASTKWYANADLLAAVTQYCGGYAHSISSPKEIASIAKLHNDKFPDYDRYPPKLSFHYILDNYSLDNFVEVIKEARKHYIPVVLLGYKELGRALKERPYKNNGWVALAKEHGFRIGIDTLIAQQYKDELDKEGVDERFYYKEEGLYSLYFDAVNNKCGKSSYADELMNCNNFRDAMDKYKQWNA